MLLVGVKENNGWLQSRWNLTYPASFNQIIKGVCAVYDYYQSMEILADDAVVEIGSKEDVADIEECGSITVRGYSSIVKKPIMITFYNQISAVDVTVPMDNEEFDGADYEKFNLSLGQYLDSIEIMMHK